MQGIIECTGAAGSIRQRDADEKFDLLAEANDILLDRANICMDDEDGVKRKPEVELVVSQGRQNDFGSWNTTATPPDSRKRQHEVANGQSIRLLAAKNIQRPQLSFKDKIDNSSKPWEPRIKEKPNSLKPLALYLIEGENGEVFCHPYEVELDKFSVDEKQLVPCQPIKPKSLEDTPLIVIEKPEDLKILLADLMNYNEIAIDLEHHSYRTYQGITCLLQISTRDTDYLIDTLTLRSELHILNEIFTKPTVLKVLHGAENDIQWLQRDLSLYIVNMFDTYQAAKHLNLPYLGLAYLLNTHCDVNPNKLYQLADWRMRPLPEELMKYARGDTHYLLYIKDILNNQLINFANGKTNILKAVYDRSTEVCKKIYEKPVCNDDSHMNMYRQSSKMFNTRQLHALKELYNWRDKIARQEDDSVGYVLPNHMMLNIAETLPREMQGILACCNPIPPLVRQHQLVLHKIILESRAKPLIKPILEEDIRHRLNQRNQTMEAGQVDGTVWSSYDMPSGTEVQDNLPCLLDLNCQQKKITTTIEEEIDHIVTVFDSPATTSDEEDNNGAGEKLKNARKHFISPFGRYKLVIPMVAAQEAKERALKEKQEKERTEAGKKLTEETEKSKERVHSHFVEVAQAAVSNTPVAKKTKVEEKKVQMNNLKTPLSSLLPGKRKREADSVDRGRMKKESKLDLSVVESGGVGNGNKRQDGKSPNNAGKNSNKKGKNKSQQVVTGFRNSPGTG